MGWRPRWRLPLRCGKWAVPRQSAAFLAGRRRAQFGNPENTTPRCEGRARRTGQQCRCVALRGGKFCKCHGGLLSAAKAEAECHGRPVVIVRNPRKKSLAMLGAHAEWPEGLPKRKDLVELGVYGFGRLVEAWQNRLLAPDIWRYEMRLRVRER